MSFFRILSRESFCFAAQKNSCTFSSFLSFVIVCCCNFLNLAYTGTLALNKSCTKCPIDILFIQMCWGCLYMYFSKIFFPTSSFLAFFSSYPLLSLACFLFHHLFMRSLLPIMMTPASPQFCFHWIIFPNFSNYPHRQRHFASPRSFVLVHHFDCHHHSCSHHLSSEALSLSCCCCYS